MQTAIAAGVGTVPPVYGMGGPVNSDLRSAAHELVLDAMLAPVLIVDDEPGIVEFLCFALEEHGYRVASARDGSAALAAIARERPACVVTDLMMPRLNGWDFTRQLRRNAATASIPIVAMSAVDPTGASADAYLRKPFELQDLLQILDGLGVSAEPDEGSGSRRG
jgi:CheY-like chemotaxis protein